MGLATKIIFNLKVDVVVIDGQNDKAEEKEKLKIMPFFKNAGFVFAGLSAGLGQFFYIGAL